MKKIRLVEVFESIQGEGKKQGIPMLFIRLYGCNRECNFCDTKYAKEDNKYKEVKINELVKVINKSKLEWVCWTGGEPLLQRRVISDVIVRTKGKKHCLETNGDCLCLNDFKLFDYIVVSPKDEISLKIVSSFKENGKDKLEIKLVVDKWNKEFLKYADSIMVKTSGDKKKDLEECKKIWNWCVKHNKFFSARIQYLIFNNERKK